MTFKTDENRIFQTDAAGKLIAEVTFPETAPGVYTIDHTFVDGSLRGQGIAAKLVQAAVDEIIGKGGEVQAVCPYAVKWLAENGRPNR